MQLRSEDVLHALRAIQRKEHKLQFSKDEHSALVFEGRQYPPKGVLKTALAISGLGSLPRGFLRSQACKILKGLGYTICRREKSVRAPRDVPVSAVDEAQSADVDPFIADTDKDTQSSEGIVNAPRGAEQADNGLVVFPDEVSADLLIEGAVCAVVVNAYERDPQARRRCIDYHGVSCKICHVNFGRLYPGVGEGYIHVHHLVPLSNIRAEYVVNPITDLLPVCPNCHAMLHRRRPDPWTPEELTKVLERGRTRDDLPS